MAIVILNPGCYAKIIPGSAIRLHDRAADFKYIIYIVFMEKVDGNCIVSVACSGTGTTLTI